MRKIELLPLFIKHPNFADKLIAGFLTGTNIAQGGHNARVVRQNTDAGTSE